MSHTSDLTYSRWERFVFWLTGRWPEAVVRRRLLADDLDTADEIGRLRQAAERSRETA